MSQSTNNSNGLLLNVEELKTYFAVKKGLLRRTVGHIKAVDGVSFGVKRGQTLGLVGYGRIAHALVPKALSFGLELIVYTPRLTADAVHRYLPRQGRWPLILLSSPGLW